MIFREWGLWSIVMPECGIGLQKGSLDVAASACSVLYTYSCAISVSMPMCNNCFKISEIIKSVLENARICRATRRVSQLKQVSQLFQTIKYETMVLFDISGSWRDYSTLASHSMGLWFDSELIQIFIQTFFNAALTKLK